MPSMFEQAAINRGTRTIQEIADLPSATAATNPELMLMRDALEYKEDLTDAELLAVCRWFRGHSSLEWYAYKKRGLNLRG